MRDFRIDPINALKENKYLELGVCLIDTLDNEESINIKLLLSDKLETEFKKLGGLNRKGRWIFTHRAYSRYMHDLCWLYRF